MATDESILQLFRTRNRNTRREQGAVATQSHKRADDSGVRRPTHADVTWQMDILDMSSRGTGVGNEYSFALLAVDVGSRRVRGELMKSRSGEECRRAFRALRDRQRVPKVIDTDKERGFLS